MKEFEETPAPYFQTDQAIGEIQLWGETFSLGQRLHQSEERYSRRDTLAPFAEERGTRLYFDARPYILVPSITLTVERPPLLESGGSYGHVQGSEWEGMQHEELGQGQAWYYPEERTLFL